MSDNNVFVLSSINQSRHFEFDVPILANKIFNTLMLKWASIVRDTLLVDVKELIGDDLTDDNLVDLRVRWLNRLFQRGKANLILEKFNKAVDTKVLSIPSNFILFDDQENAGLGKDEASDEEFQLESIRSRRARILQLRIEIETLKKLRHIISDN